MSLFQNIVLKKYLTAGNGPIAEAYSRFAGYFLNPEIQENIRNSKEEQFQEGFLHELFVKVLGYTLNPDPGFNLITEKKNETDSKKADGAILINGEVVGVIELKDGKTTDLKTVEAQAFGYKNNHRKASYVVISNYERLRFYIDNAVDFVEFNLFTLTADEFALLWLCLAWENISKNLPKQLKAESVSREDQITKQLYKDYSTFKRDLFADLTANNPKYDRLTLFQKSQKLLDRLLFILFAEDRNLLPPNSLAEIIDQWDKLKELDEYRPLYDRFKKYFGYMNTGFKGKKHDIFAYNGGLFKPDEVLDGVTISDGVLRDHSLRLSQYDFESEVDVNILGHIFENSLTEIEEITSEITTGEKQTSKRKKDGVFYTPRYITAYIVENTLGRLCSEKKTELQIDESEYFADRKRQTATKKRLDDKLRSYREWLLSLTICDPACGSGAFLNAALDFLMAEHRLIDEMTAKIHTQKGFITAAALSDIENAILENNLYGVDINEESVEIAKLALWLRTAKPHRKLNSLSDNIKCGNSLISDPAVAGDKAFDWHNEFPHVFEHGGFDVVIGNPPYLNMTKSNTPELDYYISNYESIKTANSKNLYTLFNERAISLIKEKSLVSFIIPEGFLKTRSYADCVKTMGQIGTIFKAVYFEDWVFEDATTGSMIFEFVKDKNTDYVFEEYRFNQAKQVEKVEDNINPVIKRYARLKFPALSEISETFKGMAVKDRGNFISEEHGDNPDIFLLGNCIDRYRLKNQYYTDYSKLTIVGGTKNKTKHDIAPRILIRRTGNFLCCALLDCPALTESTLYSCSIINSNFELKYLLAVLNSAFLTYMVQQNMITNVQAFPQILMTDIQSLKIPNIGRDKQQPFIDLADAMLSMNAELSAKRGRFLKRLTDNIGGIRITGALERFDESEFGGFLAELKKQKIALSLRDQDEWEEYFTAHRADCQTLAARITATDQQIDLMVYALYGLTEEEIGIIEK